MLTKQDYNNIIFGQEDFINDMSKSDSKEKTSKEAKSKTAKAAQQRPSKEGTGQKATSVPGVEQSTNKNTSIKSPAKENLRDGPVFSFGFGKSKRDKEESSSQFLKEDLDEDSQLEESHGRHQRKKGKTAGEFSSSNENLANANLERARARAGEPFLSPLRVNQGLLSGPLVASRDTDTNSRSSKETEQAEDSQGSEGSQVLEYSGGKTKKKSKTLKRADKTSTEANKTAKAAREVAKAAQNSDEEDVAPAANLDSGEESQSSVNRTSKKGGGRSPPTLRKWGNLTIQRGITIRWTPKLSWKENWASEEEKGLRIHPILRMTMTQPTPVKDPLRASSNLPRRRCTGV